MTNYINRTMTVTALIMAIFIVMPYSFTFAQESSPTATPTSAPSAAPSVAPAVTEQGNAGVVESAPAVTNQGNAGVVEGSTAPDVTNQGNAGVVEPSAPPVTNQGNAGVVETTPVVPPVTPPTGGGGSSGGGSYSGGGSGYAQTTFTNYASCTYLNDYLSINDVNSEIEVTKLQAFLKNTENLNVDINGKFDAKTFQAVKAFQFKYTTEVLSPWGTYMPTGRVFYTTKKKINEIYCRALFPLTAEQLADIQAFKNRPRITISTNTSENISIPVSTSTFATSSTPIDSEGTIGDSQAGSVGTTSFGTRVWNFIKWLFGF